MQIVPIVSLVPIFVLSKFLPGEKNEKDELSFIGNLFEINIVYNFDWYVMRD
jgi:hypothetical protein